MSRARIRVGVLMVIFLSCSLLAVPRLGALTPISPLADGPFVDIGASLPAVHYGTAAWADYDDDGDLDITLLGTPDGNRLLGRIYRNDHGVFSDSGNNLPGCTRAAIAWGDYDNDGDLDLVVTGDCGGFLSRLYRNDAGILRDSGAYLPARAYSSVAWGDYDNDGDLDLLVGGNDTGWHPTTRIYRNDHGHLADSFIPLPGIEDGELAWGDYDNDGRLDILMCGGGTRVLHNDGDRFSEISAGLISLEECSVAWGDYDNDGDLDILASGRNSVATNTLLYRNDSGQFTMVGANLPGVYVGAALWGDYDNDGDLDIFVIGCTVQGCQQRVGRLYRNDGDDVFTVVQAALPEAAIADAAWADYDNDGRLDLLVLGSAGNESAVTAVYRNLAPVANRRPSAPASLAAGVNDHGVVLSWQPALDAETPAKALTYDVRIGTTPGGAEIMSPLGGAASGYRRAPQLGNVQQGVTGTLQLAPGTYYWSVQAVDGALAGGQWATGGAFQVPDEAAWGTPTATPTATPIRPEAIYLPVIVKNVPPPTATPTVTPTPVTGWRTILAEGFEGAFPGPWQVMKGGGSSVQDYTWGKRNCLPYAGGYSGWATGGGTVGAGTPCGSSYPHLANSWMVYGPFSLADALAAEMRFKLHLNTQSGYDGMCYMASVDGIRFTGSCVTGDSGGWIERVLNLSAVGQLGSLMGQPQVWVALVFVSNESVASPGGAYVDEILLRRCVTSECPTGSSTGPERVPGVVETRAEMEKPPDASR